MKTKKIIFFTGGGTGGHIFPGIAIISKLREVAPNIEFFWLGQKGSMEENLIKEHEHIKFITIPSGKFRRYFSLKNFTDFFKVIFGIIKSFFILKKYKPQIIYATGGFVSSPPIIAASLLKIRRITHEMDLDPGLATKINSKFANKIHISFKESKKYFNNKNVLYTGSPIRKEFLNPNPNILKSLTQNTEKPIISVLGGSLGADILNKLTANIKNQINAYFIHQCGKNLDEIREKNYLRKQFFNAEEMASIVKFSRMIISRAGAGAIKEFANAGACVIFIPFVKGSRGDQLRNAKLLEEQNACLKIDEENLSESKIMNAIKKILKSKEKANILRNNIKKFHNQDSSHLIANLLLKEFEEINAN
ncbi:undecaprenyldiphospho-muramoylpentapeptide beta-N-acetylglucosaminyltransferase [Borrelia miyamotoi]|uniref:UDP-N-acetylglucosamine--N-acetylmuramyl-(pentapeptide) pyrophosphoryl-undecaprenol N-acetylglucosamine transferase n=1 Tax=Borrelia miyamotoi TaxID=47466 RepID=A0AAX3JL04_9SPIR|nr:undecaprenyldiphospho-muramoylpentapeptide beta-N-acetylglucosaminyltransferase [Borrelia miyamotoi]QFP41614.1 undecaprenyldiphospho-muramoylpentapeptide beta-N-acetylglucosaminyltransferase [Borrelia miyamotoi]QFP47734.1 undecaprenyldiphospho-muramoylpentapeptide beta-N-acetylglucosaminyltransferase [Borrelia miyamotoi]QGT55496.1 undecaprenyldiphospho-muramoylpentapeptide beta-N-acetylglucosaminyltransferase [Borrelia miyamotoi]QGT56277.1 undecaprenyldiphospho-muramoylpentapeptide beta-N-ac